MDIIPDIKVLATQGAGFILVLLVLRIFLFKPIMDILDARRKEIEGNFERAEVEQSKAEELRSDYEKRLSAVEEEVRAKIAAAIKEGQVMREEIMSDAREQAEVILTKAQDEIRREKDKATAELKDVVATLAVDAAGKIIAERMDEKKHREMVSRFIGELGEEQK